MLGFLKPAPDAEQKISEEKVPRLYKIWPFENIHA